ncbi:hypothetical protein [Paenibacillus peoriae]|uniref:hypothetical protein n=1 Tax=Paenibacillus peoriae TaxID=59893 RepID=UPI0012D94BA8|nr:hypothetical protein [Paenibacillus peoriae]
MQQLQALSLLEFSCRISVPFSRSFLSEHTIEYIGRTVNIHCIHAHHLGRKEGRGNTLKVYKPITNRTASSQEIAVFLHPKNDKNVLKNPATFNSVAPKGGITSRPA